MDENNQGKSIRRWADFLFERFLAGDVDFVPKDDPTKLVFDWYYHHLSQIPSHVKLWAIQLARTNAELTHFHAVKLITEKKQHPSKNVHDNCLKYIKMMQSRELQNNPSKHQV